MNDYRHAGMGWPNGAVSGGNDHILSLPSDDLLMLGSEHWHHDEAVKAGKRVLFRGMARRGFRPAELGWDVKRYVDEVTRDAVTVSEPITDFVGWNEWNLQDERGDQRDDFGDLTNLFMLLGGFQFAVLTELQKRPVTKNARLHFGAWAPKDETDYTDHWRTAASLADVIDVHAYGPGPGILAHIAKYRALFPGKPIELTEWHSNEAGPEQDRDTLAMLANEAAVRSTFRAYYFLWRWDDPPAHQRDLAEAIAVEGNSDRLSLFFNPPLATASPPPVIAPDPPPPEEPPMPDYPLGVDVASYQGNPDWQIAREQGGLAFAWTKATEGLTYVNSYFARNWFSIKDNGLYRGAYHYGRVANDPTAEADFFVSKVKAQGLEPGDLLALDIEEGAGDLSGWVADFINRVEVVAGFLPCLYSSPSFIAEHGLGTPETARAPLWLASWGSQMPAPPRPWPAVSFWQFSDGIDVPGIAGPVDGDRWNGSVERIPLLGKPGSTAPSEPPTSTFSVGPGILAAMAASADDPATDEIGSATGQYAEAWGTSGAHYVYLKLTNRTYRYDPAA
jgi:lysozyme